MQRTSVIILGSLALGVGYAAFVFFVLGNSHRPQLFKDETYPPKTSEEKAMWEWWNWKQKEDPSFEWKQPISFYGQVVDQFGHSVPGASVEMTWTDLSPEGASKQAMTSDSNGCFSLTNTQGKALSVLVEKPGYLPWPKMNNQGFEFAAFFQPDFYVPDPAHPVLFKLWKISPTAEWLVRGDNAFNVANGEAKGLELAHGRVLANELSANGDLKIKAYVSPMKDARGRSDYTIEVTAPRGGLVESPETLMVKAPTSGYQSSYVFAGKADDPNWVAYTERRFYVVTGDHRYATVTLHLAVFSSQACGVQIHYFYNPSGSPNLELDPSKLTEL